MGEGSAIEWTDHTFNPWVGCEKVSPGCAHCYAETLVTGRMNRPGTWGADGVRQRTSESTWALPRRWERAAGRFADEHGRRQRVFCASLADVFEPRPELVPWRLDVLRLIVETPSLDWLVLTKRPEVAAEILGGEAIPNLWLGTSIENSRHTWRADVLRSIPAAVRFISAEPLLGSLLDSSWPGRKNVVPLDLSGIDWIIVGGESGGRSARPMQPRWAREIRDACLSAVSVSRFHDEGSFRPAFFFKQWGSWYPSGLLDESGDDRMGYVGASPKSGGDRLDGRRWREFPAPGVDVARHGQQTLL